MPVVAPLLADAPRSRTFVITVGILVAVLLNGCAVESPTLRGRSVSTFDCPQRPATPPGDPSAVNDVTALRLCSLAPESDGVRSVTRRGHDATFRPLLDALSTPSEPPGDGPCSLYLDAPHIIVAQTPLGAFRIELPVDSCGHFPRSVLDAIAAAEGSGLAPS